MHRLRAVVDKFPFAAKLFRDYRDTRDLNKMPQMSTMGFKFIGNNAMRLGQFEPEETDLVKSLIPKIDAFINVGANIGYYCCLVRSAEVETFAFEPMPLNLQYLMTNIIANEWKNGVEIFPMALAAKPGIVKMYGGGTGASLLKGWANTTNNYPTLVPCNTLESVLGDRLIGKRCLILIDIEGAELGCLQGSMNIINQSPKPLWLVEICVGEHQPAGTKINPALLETFELFWNAGYVANTVSKIPREVTHAEIVKIIESGIDTLGTHNFIFSDVNAEIESYQN
jgi:FkbM family methyltransferase